MMYHDKDWLEEQYWRKGLGQQEIADLCGVDESTISRWMDKHDISSEFAEWVSEENLRNLYHEQSLSLRDIGNKFGVDSETVRRAMEENEVKTRDRLEYQKHRWLEIKSINGYPAFQEQSFDENSTIKVHRLLAVAEYGIDEIKDMHVHHRNGVRWDNRPGNIELLSPSEHMQIHAEEREMWKESNKND